GDVPCDVDGGGRGRLVTAAARHQDEREHGPHDPGGPGRPPPHGTSGHVLRYPRTEPRYRRHSSRSRLRLAVRQARARHESKSTSHDRTRWSSPAEKSRSPSGAKTRPFTGPSWPVRGSPTGIPLWTSHRMTSPSAPAEARAWPRPLKATPRT